MGYWIEIFGGPNDGTPIFDLLSCSYDVKLDSVGQWRASFPLDNPYSDLFTTRSGIAIYTEETGLDFRGTITNREINVDNIPVLIISGPSISDELTGRITPPRFGFENEVGAGASEGPGNILVTIGLTGDHRISVTEELLTGTEWSLDDDSSVEVLATRVFSVLYDNETILSAINKLSVLADANVDYSIIDRKIKYVDGTRHTGIVLSADLEGGGEDLTLPFTIMPPDNPTSVSATDGDTESVLSWVAAARATNYRYRYRVQGSGTLWTERTTSGTSVTITGLINGMTYELEVRAENSSGSSTYVATTATPAAAVSVTAPDSPTGLNATDGDSDSVVTWQAAARAVNYNVRWRQRFSSDAWDDATVTGTTYTITGLTNGVTYDIEVRAQNTAGNSMYVATTTSPSNAPLLSWGNSIGGRFISFNWVWGGGNPTTWYIQSRASSSASWERLGSTAGTGRTLLQGSTAFINGQEFRLSDDETGAGSLPASNIITWPPPSASRAASPVDSLIGPPNIGISSIYGIKLPYSESENGVNVYSRVYPFGGKVGNRRVTLGDSAYFRILNHDNYPVKSEEVSDQVRYYIESQEGGPRGRYKTVNFPEIIPVNNRQDTPSNTSLLLAGDELFGKALTFLKRHEGPDFRYELTPIGIPRDKIFLGDLYRIQDIERGIDKDIQLVGYSRNFTDDDEFTLHFSSNHTPFSSAEEAQVAAATLALETNREIGLIWYEKETVPIGSRTVEETREASGNTQAAANAAAEAAARAALPTGATSITVEIVELASEGAGSRLVSAEASGDTQAAANAAAEAALPAGATNVTVAEDDPTVSTGSRQVSETRSGTSQARADAAARAALPVGATSIMVTEDDPVPGSGYTATVTARGGLVYSGPLGLGVSSVTAASDMGVTSEVGYTQAETRARARLPANAWGAYIVERSQSQSGNRAVFRVVIAYSTITYRTATGTGTGATEAAAISAAQTAAYVALGTYITNRSITETVTTPAPATYHATATGTVTTSTTTYHATATGTVTTSATYHARAIARGIVVD